MQYWVLLLYLCSICGALPTKIACVQGSDCLVQQPFVVEKLLSVSVGSPRKGSIRSREGQAVSQTQLSRRALGTAGQASPVGLVRRTDGEPSSSVGMRGSSPVTGSEIPRQHDEQVTTLVHQPGQAGISESAPEQRSSKEQTRAEKIKFYQKAQYERRKAAAQGRDPAPEYRLKGPEKPQTVSNFYGKAHYGRRKAAKEGKEVVPEYRKRGTPMSRSQLEGE